MIQPSLLSSTGCRLVTADGRTLSLRQVSIDVDAHHGLAQAQVRQTFENRFDEPLRVTYQMPLPADGAVVGYAFVLGDRRIEGRIRRRQDAREAFEQAVVEGRTAALLEEDRSSLFTQEIGNLPPGATVEITIDVEQPLAWSTVVGGWTWRFPTVIAPRFLGRSSQTPDAERITQNVTLSEPQIPCSVTATLRDTLTASPTSASHALEGDGPRFELGGTLDRDIVLSWPVAPLSPTVELETARLGDHAEATGRLTLVPPHPTSAPTPWHRDLIVLLDTSGSMGGAPMAHLKAITKALIGSLSSGDRLEIVSFGSRVTRWQPHPTSMDESGRQAALAYVDTLRASGGTYMHEGILEALKPLRDEACRQVVVMTDGLIGFEDQILGHVRKALPAGCRVHTVGVGSAPNRTLTEGLARAGGGYEALVGLENVDQAVAELLARTAEPLLVDVELQGSALITQAPARIVDVLAGHPATAGLTLRPEGGQLVVTARTPTGAFRQVIDVPATPPNHGRRVVAPRYARQRVADLEVARAAGESVDAEVEQLGLTYGTATRLTSWLAETERSTVDPTAPTREQTVPQVLPYGMSAEGVGLRGRSRRAASPSMALRSGAPKKRRKVRAKFQELGSAPKAPAPSEIVREEFEGFEEFDKAAEPMPTVTPHRPGSVQRIGNRLVIRVPIAFDIDWDATSILLAVNGTDHRVSSDPAATTAPSRLTTGQTATIVVEWEGDLPSHVQVGDWRVPVA
ncbi:MAG: VIT and VWA domain-containing protein [Myxococcota bacterium]